MNIENNQVDQAADVAVEEVMHETADTNANPENLGTNGLRTTEQPQIVPSAFDLTAIINSIAGKPAMEGRYAGLLNQLQLIKAEVKELEEALIAHDFEGFRREILDVLFTVYGMQHLAGLNGNIEYIALIQSQQTKFDYNHDDAKATHDHYEELGIKTETLISTGVDGSEAFVCVVDGDQGECVDGVYKYPNRKWLKGLNFKPIDLPPAPQKYLEYMGFVESETIVVPDAANDDGVAETYGGTDGENKASESVTIEV